MKIKLTHPLISCMCITARRPEMLLKAIVNFDQQNYPNKELVISYPDNDAATRELLTRMIIIVKSKVLIVSRPPELSVGEARNDALSKCNGDYIAVWDDDDYHHWMRLMHQFNHMQKNGSYLKASVLSKILLYDSKEDRVYITFRDYWCGSLLCSKQLMERFTCDDADINEFKPLLQFLATNRYADEIDDSAQLYIFICHGQNITKANQFFDLMHRSRLLDQEDSDLVRPFIHEEYHIN